MRTNLISILASLVVLVVFLFITYQILEITDPPVAFDGHKVMPLKIVFESIVISLIVSIIFFIFFRKYIKRK